MQYSILLVLFSLFHIGLAATVEARQDDHYWMQDRQTGCLIWNGRSTSEICGGRFCAKKEKISASWSGRCEGERAQGTGTLTWYIDGIKYLDEEFTDSNGLIMFGGRETASDAIGLGIIRFEITHCEPKSFAPSYRVIRGDVIPELNLASRVVTEKLLSLAEQTVWRDCPIITRSLWEDRKTEDRTNIVVQLYQGGQKLVRARSYERDAPDKSKNRVVFENPLKSLKRKRRTIRVWQEYSNDATSKLLRNANARLAADKKQRKSELERKRQEAAQRTHNARKEAARIRRAAFEMQTGIKVWPSGKELKVNPFPFKGKVIGLKAEFERMLSETDALLSFTHSSEKIILAKAPYKKLRRSGPVVLAGRLLGKVGPALSMELAGIYFCSDRKCSKMFYGVTQ